MDKEVNILLISPDFYRLSSIIIDELKSRGYIVTAYEWRPKLNFFKKIFFKGFRGIQNSMMQRHVNRIIKETEGKKFDMIFFCSVVYFSEEQIKQLTEHFKDSKKVYFMWDTIENYPVVAKHIPYFDKFYSFDLTDCDTYSLEYQGDFAEPNQSKIVSENKEYDLVYLATCDHERYRIVKDLEKYCDANNLSHKFVLLYKSKKLYRIHKFLHPKYMKGSKISDFIFTPYTIEQKDELYSKAKALVDTTRNKQHGLTNRCVDALTSGMKIVTNNVFISQYDLYSKNNVVTFSPGNYSQITREFLDGKADKVDPKVVETYSIKSFIDKIVTNNLNK